MNAEQASKRVIQEPTRLIFGEGRRRWGRRATRAPSGPAGVLAMACMHTGERCNTGSPVGRLGGVPGVGDGRENGIDRGVGACPGRRRLCGCSGGELGIGHAGPPLDAGRGSVSRERSPPNMASREEDRRSRRKRRKPVMTRRVPSSRVPTSWSGSATGPTVSTEATAPVSGVRTRSRRCRRTRCESCPYEESPGGRHPIRGCRRCEVISRN